MSLSRPKVFRSDMEFLEYVALHSQTPRALFSTKQVGYFYELAGKEIPFEFTSYNIFMTLPHDEPTTRELLYKAFENVYEKRRLSKSIEDASRKSENNIVCLDDYR